MSNVPDMNFFADPGFEIMYDSWWRVFNEVDVDGNYILTPDEANAQTLKAKKRAIVQTLLTEDDARELEKIACRYARVLPDLVMEVFYD